MNLPISLASNPFAAKETEFGETMLSPDVCSIAVEHVVPSTLEGNAKCVYVNSRNYGNNAGILTSPYLWHNKAPGNSLLLAETLPNIQRENCSPRGREGLQEQRCPRYSVMGL